jgi:hypothetical protein
MTLHSVPSREGNSVKELHSFARVFPHAQRISGNRQVSWLPGHRLRPPSRIFTQWHLELWLAGHSCGNSVGFEPTSLFTPLYVRHLLRVGRLRGTSLLVNAYSPSPLTGEGIMRSLLHPLNLPPLPRGGVAQIAGAKQRIKRLWQAA